jgi:hypothetical protein
VVTVMVTDIGAQNTYYYRPSSSNRYKTLPSAVETKKSINSINSIDDDDFDSFVKPNYNSFIKPYNPFTSGWGRPAVQQPSQYRWKPDFDSFESDESDEYYHRRPAAAKTSKTLIKPVSYYNSDSNESDEVYRRVIAQPSSKKATTTRTRTRYYHSDESDEDIYRRFLASYRKF